MNNALYWAFVFFCVGISLGTLVTSKLADSRLEARVERMVGDITLVVGTKEPCMVEVKVRHWRSMNNMGLAKWVYACELERKK